MAKKIKFTYKDKDYTLEYNRKAIEKMEEDGYSISKSDDMPLTVTFALIKYAFIMHHSGISDTKVEEIVKNLPDKEKLTQTLSEMVLESVDFLTEEPDAKNAIQWTTI